MTVSRTAIVAAAGATVVAAAEVTPVQKVISMLAEMEQTGKTDMQAEKVQFAAYAEFCKNTSTEKARNIKTGVNEIAKLDADIEEFQATADRNTQEIADHTASVNEKEAEVADATKIRAAEREEFEAQNQDYNESLDALPRAIEAVKGGNKDIAQESFLQVSHLLNESAHNKYTEFLAQAPAAAAYESSSNGVVDTLEDLLEKFRTEHFELNTEETNSKHAFQVRKQNLEDEVASLNNQISLKTGYKSTALENKGAAEADKVEAEGLLKEDRAYKTKLDATCSAKKNEFGMRMNLRVQELEALATAQTILAGGNVAAHAENHAVNAYKPEDHLADVKQAGQDGMSALKSITGSLADDSEKRDTNRKQVVSDRDGSVNRASISSGRAVSISAVSLLQVKTVLSQLAHANNVNSVFELLQSRGRKFNSRVLMQLAGKAELASKTEGSDPFRKVKEMIEKLIVRLEEEARAEAQHKAYCDTEIAKNKKERTRRESEVDRLSGEIDFLTANIAFYTKKIDELTGEIKQLNADHATATQLRNAEKAKNTKTIAEAKEAHTAVAEAKKVLSEFYEKAAAATSLMQRAGDAQDANRPEIFNDGTDPSAMKGQQAAGANVLGFLEVIHADFMRLQTGTEAAEKEAQLQYDVYTIESKKLLKEQEADKGHKVQLRKEAEATKKEAEEDREEQRDLLEKANTVFAELKPKCIDTSANYGDRVEQRENEVQSLKEALEMLGNSA